MGCAAPRPGGVCECQRHKGKDTFYFDCKVSLSPLILTRHRKVHPTFLHFSPSIESRVHKLELRLARSRSLHPKCPHGASV
jgi:hypothetical protein